MSAPNVRDSNAAALSSLPADLTSSSNEVVRWQSALNATAQATLHQLAEFEPMNAGAQEWGMARQAFPQLRCGEVWFQKVVDASTDQAALVVRDQPTAPGRVLVDPNLLTRERGTPAMPRALGIWGLMRVSWVWLRWVVSDFGACGWPACRAG